jgi:hypothetical protein
MKTRALVLRSGQQLDVCGYFSGVTAFERQLGSSGSEGFFMCTETAALGSSVVTTLRGRRVVSHGLHGDVDLEVDNMCNNLGTWMWVRRPWFIGNYSL